MQFFRNKRLFILLIGFIVLVALIGYSLNNRENLSTPVKFINDAVGWTQEVIHTPVKFITDIVSNINDFKNTYEENQLLKEQLSQYQTLTYEVQEIKKENEELMALLEIEDSARDYDPIQATVISRSPERWVEQVTINKGRQDGVTNNMVVITAEGMVGKIQSASEFTSTVQLLTGFDQFNRISATISRGDDEKSIFGMIEGFEDETNSLLFRIIEESDKNLEEGELVVSSELGGEFPAGLPIGTVKEVVSDQYGLTRIAMVEPAADLYELSHVIVVDRALGSPEENSDEEEDE
ncbi:rod shape-determining protein MreC [Oceanobacillus polygoni]|uniref:Cell shape-determining protein MreC n=1 Tax=Oceanobacillus polygoni TaxID=1235259 RepID=A0A9X0YUL6_9BACI|nr:rod shape-determining protein MreC [Oceanobacillus polygoni]MBP2077444.1 rod shape-determining protein MreC [Oceanobacillus polygoni]